MELEKDNSLINEYNSILKQYFNYDSLKPEQYEIIDTLLNKKKDVLAILCTSFGKSITFQMVFLISKKCVFVISPLLSLINDQITHMESCNIPVCKFNSECNKKKQEEIKTEILKGNTKLIYTTPEWIEKNTDFIQELEELNLVSLIAIDEAHSISTWSDFRPSYKKLNKIREKISLIPILGLTATASEKVRNDIITELNLKNYLLIIGDFNRPNLYLEVIKKSKTLNEVQDIYNKIMQFPTDQHIIYCKKKDDTEKISMELNRFGLKTAFFHADIPVERKMEIQQKVITNEISCVIATTAYGQGINTPNVRTVIHFTPSKNLENYYQEIGRAGRDGLPSYCYLYYDKTDIQNHLQQVDKTNQQLKKYQEEQVQKMDYFLHTDKCRKKTILCHFGQLLNEDCENCDNCKNKTVPSVKRNYVYEAYLFLSLLTKLNEKTGGTNLIKIILGSNAKTIKPAHKLLEEYGKGISFGKEEKWKDFLRLLKNNEFIIEKATEAKFGTVLSITTKGRGIIRKYKELYPTYSELLNADYIEELYL